ncbi:MAG: ATPase [Flavobacteriales bacterium]|nr:ATPase [Flavobacteriales bacterium]
MVLIADSGSTKCDWALLDSKGNKLGIYETIGLNPYFHTSEAMSSAIQANAELSGMGNEITNVFFYGAGASTETMCSIVMKGLQKVFPKASILVDHDLVGCAYATYDGEPCISCILGTGSNSCYFDGTRIYEEVPSLAFILGDEGSGSYFGKILLREYFYKKLPLDLRAAFDEHFKVTRDDIISKIYREPNANVYLASFTRFIGSHVDHPHVHNWIVNGMKEFIDIHVQCFSNWREVPVHFVGSVSHYFRKGIEEAAAQTGMHLGRIIRKPIDGLVEYHVKYKWPILTDK